MKDTIINIAHVTITLTGETRTTATLCIGERTYVGEVGNPNGKANPEDWIERSLMVGLYHLSDEAYVEAIYAIESEMM